MTILESIVFGTVGALVGLVVFSARYTCRLHDRLDKIEARLQKIEEQGESHHLVEGKPQDWETG